MGIYTGFGLESMIQLLLEGEFLWMYGLILLAVLAISHFGILWTANSIATLGNDRQFGEIGNNWLYYNDISLYIGIDHPDVPLSQLSSNGLSINTISDISNYKIHVKTWCNYFDTYSTAGMMLGSDIRNQGDALVDCGNYSSDPSGLSFFNPNTNTTPNLFNYFIEPFRTIDYLPYLGLPHYNLYQSPNVLNSNLNLISSQAINLCLNVPGYKRSSGILNSDKKGSHFDLNNTLTLFPNPFEIEFRIESSSVSIKEIELFDVLGRSILKDVGLFEKTHLINLYTAPGCYLLKVVLTNGEVTYHKIVKSND